MDLASSISIYGGGEGSGCHGENCGRPSGKSDSGLGKLLKDVVKVWGEDNLWSRLGKYGRQGKTEPFTKAEIKELRKIRRGVPPCKVGFCVMNAQRIASNALHDDRVKYVEGLVIVHSVPIDHAWIEFNGKVFDPTLASEQWKMKGKAERGEYWGIEVPKNMILTHQVATGYYKFISHDRKDEIRKRIWK